MPCLQLRLARLRMVMPSAIPAFMANRDVPIHRWVPWIAGYSKSFVEDAISRYTSGPSVVLDPFAGVGTTLVEADLAGHEAIGFEINPYAAFAAQAKLKAHRIDPDHLRSTVDAFHGVHGERCAEKDQAADCPASRVPYPHAILQPEGRAKGVTGLGFHRRARAPNHRHLPLGVRGDDGQLLELLLRTELEPARQLLDDPT